MHQKAEHAALTGQEGKRRVRITSRRNSMPPKTHFDYTFMGLEPGTTKADVRKLSREIGDKGDNGMLDLSKAYRSEARHRLDDPRRRAARARFPLHLRAAMG